MTTAASNRFDAVVIGGGMFGMSVALFLKNRGLAVLVVEREGEILTRASYRNQARVHAGYHYPRSLITALRSSVNFPRFEEEFRDCVVSDFPTYYAIAKVGSKVSAKQFTQFLKKIGAPLEPAPKHVVSLFNPALIEAVFTVREYAFNARKLAAILTRRAESAGLPILRSTAAASVRAAATGPLCVSLRHLDSGTTSEVVAEHVFNCTYSQLNRLNVASHLGIIPLRHELAEIALVEPAPTLNGAGVTVMCGPFFSTMPFPADGLHSFSHVRYTPHFSWPDRTSEDVRSRFDPDSPGRETAFRYMQMDAARFLPCLAECRYVRSLWEVKTVLPLNEVDDARPILFRACEELPGLYHLLGGKIDNIFDVLHELDSLFACR